MTDAPATTRRHRFRWPIILLAIMAGSLFVGLENIPLMDEDEPRFSTAARTMVETGDYIKPWFNDQPRYAKPVLIYWLMAGCYRVFGFRDMAPRLPSTVFSVLTALALYCFARALGRRRLGIMAAAAWLCMIQTTIWARAAITDATLTFFIMSALMCLFLGFRAEGRQRDLAFAAAGAAMGLAFLTKGLMGIVLPGFIALVYLLWTRQLWQQVTHIRWWQPLLLFAVIGLPWYMIMYRIDGMVFIRAFFWHEHAERFLRGFSHHRTSPLNYLYYVAILLTLCYPWGAMIPAALGQFRSRAFRVWKPAGQDLGRFLAVWFGAIFLGFSLSKTKNPQYIQATYPALCLLVAALFEHGIRRWKRLQRVEKLTIAACLVVGVLFSGIFAALPWLLRFHARQFDAEVPPAIVPTSWALTAVLLGGTVAATIAWARGARWRAYWLWVLTLWVFGILLVYPTGPLVASYSQVPIVEASKIAGEHTPEGKKLILYRVSSSDAVYYSHRARTEVKKRALMREIADRRPELTSQQAAELAEKLMVERVARLLATGEYGAVLTRRKVEADLKGVSKWQHVGGSGPYVVLIPAKHETSP